MNDYYTFWMSCWATTLSTALAILRGWEFFREGPRLSAKFYYVTHPDVGSELIIINNSKTQAIILNWDLILEFRKSKYNFQYRSVIDPAICFDSLIVPPYDKIILNFHGSNHFLLPEYSPGKKFRLFIDVVRAGKTAPIRLPLWASGD